MHKLLLIIVIIREITASKFFACHCRNESTAFHKHYGSIALGIWVVFHHSLGLLPHGDWSRSSHVISIRVQLVYLVYATGFMNQTTIRQLRFYGTLSGEKRVAMSWHCFHAVNPTGVTSWNCSDSSMQCATHTHPWTFTVFRFARTRNHETKIIQVL